MADDDTQSELMDQFLEKITPKLTEAVMEQVSSKLTEVEKGVHDRLEGLADKNADLLGKLHKSKGGSKTLEEQVAFLADQLAGKGQKPTEIVLSKTDARDVQKYREARKQADEAGLPLRIDREAS